MATATHPLQYYIHDEPGALRLELAGTLSGAGVESVYHAWLSALGVIGQRRVIVDISFITEADERGRNLLRLWQRTGARIIAGSDQSRAVAGDIELEPAPAREKRGWWERVRGLLLG